MVADIARKKVEWGDPSQEDVWHALERFQFETQKAEFWLKAMGTLMARQIELGVQSVEEVEKAMDKYNNNPEHVIELFVDTASLQKRGDELGKPAREDIKMVLDLFCAHTPQERTGAAAAVLRSLTSLMRDTTAVLSLGIDGVPSGDDKMYMALAFKRFDGDREEGVSFMKSVADIMRQGEELGSPAREQVIAVLEANRFDLRVTVHKLRDAYRDVKNARRIEEYRKIKREHSQ